MDNLNVETPGMKYCHFPRRDDYGTRYFNGLLSEHLVYKEGHRQPWQWEKIPGHERNEALDCRNYALAAFKTLPANLDAIDRRLQAVRSKSPTEPVATPVKAAPKPQVTSSKSPMDKFYDSW